MCLIKRLLLESWGLKTRREKFHYYHQLAVLLLAYLSILSFSFFPDALCGYYIYYNFPKPFVIFSIQILQVFCKIHTQLFHFVAGLQVVIFKFLFPTFYQQHLETPLVIMLAWYPMSLINSLIISGNMKIFVRIFYIDDHIICEFPA